MLTFQDQYQMTQQIANDFSTATLVLFKRDINEGCAMFLNRLGRKFNKEYLTANIVSAQQYYQFPSEVLRISEARFLQGTNYYSPNLITNEEEWNKLNAITTSGAFPTKYYIRGFNEIGVYPVPNASITNGVIISYEPQHVDLTQDDFTTGTVTVSNGSPNGTTITHSATGFTQNMVGRWFQVTDGTDGKWYRIGAYVSTSVLTLDNYYEGLAGSGRNFRIGEVSKIPQAYQDAPVYYALDRYFQTQNDQRTAPMYQQRFDLKIKSAKETYAHSTSRMGVKSRRSGRQPSWLDLTKPVIYP